MARVEKDMNSPEVKAALQESFTLAEALGFQGTPSYVIGNEAVVGAVGVKELQAKINNCALRQGDLLTRPEPGFAWRRPRAASGLFLAGRPAYKVARRVRRPAGAPAPFSFRMQ